MNSAEKNYHHSVDRRKVIQDAILRQNYKRKIVNKVFTGLTIVCVVLAMIPLSEHFV